MKNSKVITQSKALPINLAEVKQHLGIYHTEKDFNLTVLMAAATTIAEKFTGQIFRIGGDVFDQYFDAFPATLDLDYAPATGITHVKYFDYSNAEQTLSTGYYQFLDFTTPQRIEFDDYLPGTYTRQDACHVRYVAGYSKANNVPYDVRAAIMLITQYIYDNPGDSVRQLPTASEYILRNYKVR